MYLNKTFLFGNLTRDPEMKSLPNGTAVTQFSIATNRIYKDAQGQKQEQAEYHNIVIFGRQAETVAQYMKKGSSILVEGRMQTRSWDDKGTGEKKYRTEIIADRTQFGSKGTPSNNAPATSTPSSEAPKEDDMGGIEYPEEDINPEDIPF